MTDVTPPDYSAQRAAALAAAAEVSKVGRPIGGAAAPKDVIADAMVFASYLDDGTVPSA